MTHFPIAARIVRFAKLIPYGSFLGITLALIFDAGYFLALGMRQFSYFSLSEHLLFALQILPMAVIVLCFLPVFFSIVDFLRSREQKKSGRVPLVVFAVLFVAYCLFGYFVAPSRLEIVLVPILIAALLSAAFCFDKTENPLLFALYIALILMLSALSCGYIVAWGSIKSSNVAYTITFKTDSAVQGTILRSGERGVLMYDVNTKTIELRPWDSISAIKKRVE